MAPTSRPCSAPGTADAVHHSSGEHDTAADRSAAVCFSSRSHARSGGLVHAQERTRTSKGFYSHQHLKLRVCQFRHLGGGSEVIPASRRKSRASTLATCEDAPTIATPEIAPMAGDPPRLRINEVFHSIQGESTWAGLPVRLHPADRLPPPLPLLRHRVRLSRGRTADDPGPRRRGSRLRHAARRDHRRRAAPAAEGPRSGAGTLRPRAAPS